MANRRNDFMTRRSIMAARTTRQEARWRILNACQKMLDQIIPEDESLPLKGRTFLEWEDQTDAFDATVTGTLLQERAALEDSAQAQDGELGCCPHCGSERLYLQRGDPENKTMRTPHGEVVVGHQNLRCRPRPRSRPATGLFPPQRRDLDLPAQAALSPKYFGPRLAKSAKRGPRQGNPFEWSRRESNPRAVIDDA